MDRRPYLLVYRSSFLTVSRGKLILVFRSSPSSERLSANDVCPAVYSPVIGFTYRLWWLAPIGGSVVNGLETVGGLGCRVPAPNCAHPDKRYTDGL